MATETVTPTQAGKAATTLGDTVKSAVKDMAQAAVNDAVNIAVEETIAPVVGQKVAEAAEEALDKGADRFLAAAEERVEDTIAHEAPRGFRHALSRGPYRACYGLSYGAVYSAVFVTELLPEGGTVRRGFADGARAARIARASMNKLRAEQATASTPSPNVPSPRPVTAAKTPAMRRRASQASSAAARA